MSETASQAIRQSFWSHVRLQDHLNAVVIEIDDEFHVLIVGLLPYLCQYTASLLAKVFHLDLILLFLPIKLPFAWKASKLNFCAD